MLYVGHFGSHQHTGFFLDPLQPGQPFGADSFKRIGPGAGFPYPRPVHLYPLSSQLTGRFHYLFLRFGTAGAGHNQRPLVFNAREQGVFQFQINSHSCLDIYSLHIMIHSLPCPGDTHPAPPFHGQRGQLNQANAGTWHNQKIQHQHKTGIPILSR